MIIELSQHPFGRRISFLLYAHNKYDGVSQAVSKWFSALGQWEHRLWLKKPF